MLNKTGVTKINTGRFFEDFILGEVIHHPTPRTITEGDAALYMGLTGARQILFSAETVAQSMGYKTRPIDDLLAFHIAFGKTVPDISVNAVANLGYAEVQFLQPVFSGDTLKTHSTVIGLKQNASGKSGVVYVRSVSVNQLQQTVFSWVRWVMVHKRDANAPAPETVIPTLENHVPVEKLQVPSCLDARKFDTSNTGSANFWEDYAIGERINHPAGMTISDTDHTLATKLYQNNARLHFDDVMMKKSSFGKRLMYGGHVISICRALSYDGLENALSILAINAGTHCNPTFGGDTIYCATEILDKWPLSHPNVGALRLRMIGIKNICATEIDAYKTADAYHPNVVLDLDYTILIPRKGN
jgi:2-methylfumaryl-CoA hydratase